MNMSDILLWEMQIQSYLHKVPEGYSWGAVRVCLCRNCAGLCPYGPAIGGRDIDLSLKPLFVPLSLLQGWRNLV